MQIIITKKVWDIIGAMALIAVTVFCIFKMVTYDPPTINEPIATNSQINSEYTLVLETRLQSMEAQIAALEGTVHTQDESIKQLYDFIFESGQIGHTHNI